LARVQAQNQGDEEEREIHPQEVERMAARARARSTMGRKTGRFSSDF